MAAVYIPTVKATVGGVAQVCNPNQASDDFTLTAVSDTTNGAWLARTFNNTNAVEEEFKDQKTFIILQNAGNASANVVFKAGDSYAAKNDLTVAVGAGKMKCIQIDSAYFKVVNSATGLGAVHIVPSAAVSVAVFEGS